MPTSLLVRAQEPENIDNAVACLNHLARRLAVRSPCLWLTRGVQVTNAMAHATDSLEYMSRLRDPQVFRFCAIPQVMAIATLAECYDNPKVFRAVVKIPRTMRCACVVASGAHRPLSGAARSARIMVNTKTMGDVLQYFRRYSRKLEAKVRSCVMSHALRRRVTDRQLGRFVRRTPTRRPCRRRWLRWTALSRCVLVASCFDVNGVFDACVHPCQEYAVEHPIKSPSGASFLRRRSGACARLRRLFGARSVHAAAAAAAAAAGRRAGRRGVGLRGRSAAACGPVAAGAAGGRHRAAAGGGHQRGGGPRGVRRAGLRAC